MKNHIDKPLIALQWWHRLQGGVDGTYQSGASRSSLSNLRRANLQEAMAEEETLRLFSMLEETEPYKLSRIAVVSMVLSHIRTNDTKLFGRAIGRAMLDDAVSAPLSVLRFRNLLNAETDDELAKAYRRTIAILAYKANVKDVARCLFFAETNWLRQQLTLDYYAARENSAIHQNEATS
jgi:CRISPR type I-E-associated protein CasB/Cse2